jgi:UDPglucose 6-dehydrogenase
MRIGVLGLWHLGSVTAGCLAGAGHDVIGFDPDPDVVRSLSEGRPPVAEPGLPALIRRELQSGRLRFTARLSEAVTGADVAWITFDTPVDDEDRADADFVVRQVEAAFPYLADGAVVICSSQVPVGTVRGLEESWAAAAAGRTLSFASLPENLRLGTAIDIFTKPDRVVAGVRDDRGRERMAKLLAPITDRIEWMSVESAEMTKHAINAFLAASVTFTNELAAICERLGADAREVERGLRSERRIGPHAYVSPGSAFAGGTLARDVNFLRALGRATGVKTPLLDGVIDGNTSHSLWARQRLQAELGALAGLRVAVWGLTYKPGTDTLRRSSSVDLTRWLAGQGTDVHVHDPAASALPGDLHVTRHRDPIDAVTHARALVLATEWPIYREVDVNRLAESAPGLIVVDANRFLGPLLAGDTRFRFVSVGQPQP